MEPHAESPRTVALTVIEERFDSKPFAIGAEHIRRIVEIVRRRLSDAGQPSFTFTVTRVDSWRIETDDLETLLSDERLEDERLKTFKISAQAGGFNLDLEFSSRGRKLSSTPITPITLSLRGHDHDGVLLLASDLRKYVRSSVIQWRIFPGSIASAILLILSIIALWTLLSKQTQPARQTIDARTALKSTDVNVKLDYLVGQTIKEGAYTGAYTVPEFVTMIVIVLVMVSSVYFLTVPEPVIIRYLWPQNVFLFGSERERYASRKALRGKLLWGLGFAVVASVIGGIILWFIFHK
jgi:hypothetical protein